MPVLFQFLWIRNLAKPQTLCLGSHRTGIKVWPGLGFHLGAQKGENPLEAQSSFPHGGRVGFSSCWLLAGGYVHTQRLPVVLVTWSLFLRDTPETACSPSYMITFPTWPLPPSRRDSRIHLSARSVLHNIMHPQECTNTFVTFWRGGHCTQAGTPGRGVVGATLESAHHVHTWEKRQLMGVQWKVYLQRKVWARLRVAKKACEASTPRRLHHSQTQGRAEGKNNGCRGLATQREVQPGSRTTANLPSRRETQEHK